jgi:calcineurin-like phosphoesterase family protein
MSVWFTADPHLGHEGKNSGGIIKLAKRPFTSINEMDAVIISNINKKVMPNDILYCVGDFSMKDHNPYLERINCKTKILVPGNHDHTKRIKHATLWSNFENLKHNGDMIIKLKIDDVLIVLCHYKMATWNKSHHGSLHLYGHSHGTLPGDSQCCDVGLDCWNFEPVSLPESMKRMATHPKRTELDHHKPKKC